MSDTQTRWLAAAIVAAIAIFFVCLAVWGGRAAVGATLWVMWAVVVAVILWLLVYDILDDMRRPRP